ncbi:MAG TPA: ABC transporter permease [Amycolatopsis sp.]|uniref:ABC transporter permease n=1 Tax=Amycolatopsis sp. TaxID=37632 RepID=UPI002B46324A|nr:ABC transporter permease [Amycolatopsis sp.]HKS45209.1 ABC transporter permease [Amycolatopsis sp.]
MTAAALPGTLTLGLAQGGVELRKFFRQREAVAFTFALPALLLALLGSIFGHSFADTGVTAAQVFAASMVGSGIVSTSFVSMGTAIVFDREDGTLKRLRGTPIPAGAYFLGKIVLVVVSSLAEVALLLVVGTLLLGLHLPTSPEKWLTFAWVFVLATTSCALLGIAASSAARSPNGATAVMNLLYVGFQFISGVFVTPITALPATMVYVASFFPLKWICQGFRSVFLPDSMAAYEMAGTWELGKVSLVLGAWVVAGLVLSRSTFRWTDNR